MDLRTDALVQKAVRAESDSLFKDATVFTIAHRLNTVIDFDYILVLDKGSMVEYGKPGDLLNKQVDDPGAWFKRMVEATGKESSAVLHDVASRKKLL